MDRAEGALRVAELALAKALDAMALIEEIRVIQGPAGEPGKPGADGVPGVKGMDGRDGFGFDDMSVVMDERGVVLRFDRGDARKEFPIPMSGFVDRGVYKSDQQYQVGDSVSFGGSLWIAQQATTDKPETSKAWRLAVKHGRDGKDGKNGERGLPGPKGNDGKDLTQLLPDGRKF